MRALVCLAALVVLTGCDARIGKDAAHGSVPIYPGSRVVSNGENARIIGANLTTDPMQKVEQFYATQLGVQPGGVMRGSRNGHPITEQK